MSDNGRIDRKFFSIRNEVTIVVALVEAPDSDSAMECYAAALDPPRSVKDESLSNYRACRLRVQIGDGEFVDGQLRMNGSEPEMYDKQNCVWLKPINYG